MHRLQFAIFGGLLLFASLAPPNAAAQGKKGQSKLPKSDAAKDVSFSDEIRPLLKTYCFECHNNKKRRGDLNLEKFTTESAAADWPDVWDHVGDRVRTLEMPPAKSPQPKEADRQKLLAFVVKMRDLQVSCDKLTKDKIEKSLAGYTMSRRLNRSEYDNTMRDLFGIDLHAGNLLPSEGGGGEGFDNTGGTLFTTPTHMEKYLDAAELVVAALLPRDPTTIAAHAEAAKINAARKQLLTVHPSAKLERREAARQVLMPIMSRAFRRPVAPNELERYLALFDKAERRGDSFEQSLRLALKGVLISPNFLFLTEPAPAKEGAYRLGHYQIASRLSYFLWASMPDQELFDLAKAGKLHDENVLRGQLQRMTRDPKSRGFAESFATQWLGLRALGVTIRPDAQLFPEFNDDLAKSMREETVLFVDSILRDDRSVLDLIDAKYTFVNERLAALYKIPDVKGSHMRRIELSDPIRGGILGHASILTVTSHPHRTSPVLRGRWVLEELLGADVPPPPPNVPELGAGKKDEKKQLTLRQQLEKHRAKPECASCHNRIDPLGFGLENFDPLGRFRTEQNGKPIDTVGVLPSGEKFDGPVELKKLLLEKRRSEFLTNLSRKVLGYALARQVNRYDMCVVRDGVRSLETGEYRVSRLLETVVLSYPFNHRYHKIEPSK